MAYDTKADFAAMYRKPLYDPDTGYVYHNFYSPDVNNGQRVTITLPYTRLAFFAGKEALADRLIAHSGITSTDSIILFGGAFGWTGEWIEQKTGAVCVSVDTSAWINSDQANSEDDDLQNSIEANGLSISSGFGKEVFDKFSDPGPRCRISGGVINETLSDNSSRQRVALQLGQQPTLIITEEVWQLLSAQDQTNYTDRFNNFGVSVVHVIDNNIFDG